MHTSDNLSSQSCGGSCWEETKARKKVTCHKSNSSVSQGYDLLLPYSCEAALSGAWAFSPTQHQAIHKAPGMLGASTPQTSSSRHQLPVFPCLCFSLARADLLLCPYSIVHNKTTTGSTSFDNYVRRKCPFSGRTA